MQNTNTFKPVLKNIPLLFSKCGFKNFYIFSPHIRKKYDLILNYALGKLDKKCLVLCGNVGNGKTHLAVAVLNNIKPVTFNARNIPVRPTGIYVTADEFFCELNDSHIYHKSKLEIIKKYLSYDYMVLDDLGINNFTEAKKENLYILINRAYLDKKRLIITTNFSMVDIEKLDQRIASRLTEMASIIHFDFPDYRLNK